MHLNHRVPDALKYALHVLFVEHGKRLKNDLGVLSEAPRPALRPRAPAPPRALRRAVVQKHTDLPEVHRIRPSTRVRAPAEDGRGWAARAPLTHCRRVLSQVKKMGPGGKAALAKCEKMQVKKMGSGGKAAVAKCEKK